MKLLRGLTITDSILDASDVPENDATEWDGTGGLSAGVERMVTTTANGAASATHKVYAVASGGDSSVDPTTDDGTNWITVGSTNRYKMFNTVVQQATTQTDGFEVTLSSDATFVTGVGFINVTASSIDVEVVSGGDTLFSETYMMTEPPSTSGFWWWLFEPIERRTSLYIDELPSILGTEITATFNGSGSVSCGIMSIGESFLIGESVYGANYSIIDYSTKTEDADGNITISQGSYRDVVDAPVVVFKESFGAVSRILNANRSTPNIWFISDDYPLVYGFYDRYDLMIGNPAFSELVIRIEGLV